VTEEEWRSGTEPALLLRFLQRTGAAGDRKLRLFAVACCRRIWPLLRYGRSRRAVEASEEYADGLIGEEEYIGAAARAADAGHEVVRRFGASEAEVFACWAAAEASSPRIADSIEYVCDQAIAASAAHALEPASSLAAVGSPDGHDARLLAARIAEGRAQCLLLHDLFGDPFRTTAVDPSWRTPAALHLATVIYQGREFGLMPVLGDALEEAGCTESDLLAHLRSQDDHIRGCWALDLILEKS
jgi:hypothetical protein